MRYHCASHQPGKKLKEYAPLTVSGIHSPAFSIKKCTIAVATFALITIAQPSLAAGDSNVFGDAKLHAVEQQIIKLAEASQKDISYQEHQKLLDKVSQDIVGNISDVSSLATLAIWAYLNVHSDEFDGGFINYNHVVRTAFSSALDCIGRQATPEAQSALWRIAHQVKIDGHVSEELCEAMKAATKKEAFSFGDRVYTRFQDSILERLPLSPEVATFRIAVCDELWKHWKSPVEGSVDVGARATFVIDQDRQFTNIKVVPIYFGKHKNQAAGLQFVEAARTALEHCALKNPLPSALKKVRIEVDFCGR